MIGIYGDTDAHSHPQFTFGRLNWRRQGRQHALGDTTLQAGWEPLRHHDQLVAADPGHEFTCAADRHQPLRDAHQQRIACRVAKGVVDLLEAIKVEVQHRNSPAVTVRPGQRRLQLIAQALLIHEAGEGIVLGAKRKRARVGPPLPNIAQRDYGQTGALTGGASLPLQQAPVR